MPAVSPLGPFRPGPGGMPPYLAGREAEQRLFRELLSHVGGGEAPPGEVILCGPRGNGKTVLLGWVEAEAASEPRLDVLLVTPSEIPDRARLAETVLPDSWWGRSGVSQGSVAGTGITWRPGREHPPTVREALTARASSAPCCLLLDEAHTLDPEVGRELLNASQQVGRRLPFLLVLAGTPNLQSRLAGMDASFWNRAEQVRVSRLREAAAADAFRRPLEAESVSVAQDALAAMVRESQGYPFFVQLLGRALWRQVSALPEGRRRVTLEHLDAARPEFDRIRGEFYAHRYEELATAGLLKVGRAVADAFGRHPLLPRHDLEDAIARGLGAGPDADRTESALATLRNLGYVWRVEALPEWEPGIPSLMDYVREHAPPT